MIESVIHKTFDILMWMLIDPDGQKTFFVIDGLVVVLSVLILWFTRNEDT